ncbi:hypothetical protein [Rummeliibacillus pycnus]|uniref:hypothetical protein n=1 Tax=Rummeliibacillus pycnus TaxID=101070 RepID=UPI0037CBCF6C
MKKLLLCISVLFFLVPVVGCIEKETTVTGEFDLWNIGFTFKPNEVYYIVNTIEWTGKSPVTIKSIELIKRAEQPITYQDDGINYEFFGADPLKKSGIYGKSDIGDLKSIENLEVKGKGKIVLKLSLKDVKEDSDRRVKIKFNVNGNESEKVVEWNTLEQLTTDKDSNHSIHY